MRRALTFLFCLVMPCLAAPAENPDMVLGLSGSGVITGLRRAGLNFDFHTGGPGVDGLPVGIEGVYGTDGKPITAGYAVSVRWSQPQPDKVCADVTVSNHLDRPLQGFTVDLLRLTFPSAVVANDGNPNMRAYNSGGPGLFCANYGGPQPGALVCDLEDVGMEKPLLMKLEPGDPPNVRVLKIMNHHDSEDDGSPFPYSPVPAGGSVTFRVGLRFGPLRPDPMAVCGDLFAAFARRYPVMKNVPQWTDRRPIAQVFFESDDTNGGRNPRKWFSAGERVDTTTAAGMRHFQRLVMERAHAAIAHMKKLNAQGVITWDVEGAAFTDATYMGDPTKIDPASPAQSVAPEMSAIADAYFELYRDAGFRVGVTIRPQKVILQRDAQGRLLHAWENDDDWVGKTDPPADLQAFWQHQLEMKIRFARQRWDATLFYIDSDAGPGGAMSALIVRNLAAEFPDVLLIPEHSTLGYWSACAPYRQLNMLSADNITPGVVRRTYPQSRCFSVINPTLESMTRSWPQLVQSVRDGDILFFQAWFDAAEIPAIKRVYAEAAR